MGGAAEIDGETHPETDNFLPCNFVIDGITYPSTENYFQCAKTINKEDRDKILNSGTGESAWEAGQTVQSRSDWDVVKVEEMYKGNLAKFQQNEHLRNALLSTSTSSICFNDPDSASFWNKWNGLILERIRAELRQNGEEDTQRAAEIRQMMEKFSNTKK